MHSLNFFPLGNADCCRIDLANGKKVLIDYADTRCAERPTPRAVDLPVLLRADLDRAGGRRHYETVAFTHLDDDHICGASRFFYLEHDPRYQTGDRVRIQELWVPAAAITEDRPGGEAAVIQAEARHRLKQGRGIRVFSRPDRLGAWLARQGLSLESRRHLITDAGQVVPGFALGSDELEFFAHSPYARRMNDGGLEDRNQDSLVLQATFVSGGRTTRLILGADATHEVLADIVRVTRSKGRDDRLAWDVVKLPHHCSYLSLGPEKGVRKTEPVPEVGWLYEAQGAPGGILVSTSNPIPAVDMDCPPHRQAAAYYEQDVARPRGGEFRVTMAHPSEARPEVMVVRIDWSGARVLKDAPTGAGTIVGSVPPRAGWR